MLDVGNEFPCLPLLRNGEAPVRHFCNETSGCECTDENHRLGVLTDVDEAASARQSWAEFRDVEVAVPVSLGKAEEGDIDPAAVIEQPKWYGWSMIACALVAAPKLRPEAGTPPITPGSAVR